MFGFGWVGKLHDRVFGPWAGAHERFYVSDIRGELDDIAKALAQYGYPATATRFNHGQECGEIYNENGLIAQVHVYWKNGRLDMAVVACNLSIEAEALFAKFLPGLQIEFRALTRNA